MTLIDTADLYGPHTNELLVRDAVHPYPEHLVIATKGGFVRGGVELLDDLSGRYGHTVSARGTRDGAGGDSTLG